MVLQIAGIIRVTIIINIAMVLQIVGIIRVTIIINIAMVLQIVGIIGGDIHHHQRHGVKNSGDNWGDDHHNIVMVLQIVGIIGVTGREQEDLKRCQEAIQLTWLLVHTCSDDDDDRIP